MLLIGGSVGRAARRSAGAGDLLPSGAAVGQAQRSAGRLHDRAVRLPRRPSGACSRRRCQRRGAVARRVPGPAQPAGVGARRTAGRSQQQIVPSQLRQGSLTLADRRLREGGWAALRQPIAREATCRSASASRCPPPPGRRRCAWPRRSPTTAGCPGAIVINATNRRGCGAAPKPPSSRSRWRPACRPRRASAPCSGACRDRG